MIERLVHEQVADRDDSSLYRAGELAALMRHDLSTDLNGEICTFMRSLAHAMRSPIWVADAFSHMLEDDEGHSTDDARERVSHIRVAVARLLSIVDGIEQLGRSASRPISWMEVDLGEIATQAFHTLRQCEELSLIDFRVADQPLVLGDSDLIEIALHHLVENACTRVCKTPSAWITVGVLAESPDDIRQCGHVLCYVSDNGPGFGVSQPEELFTLFGCPSSTQGLEIDGVGLAVARRIIHRHGGKIWAEAKPGRGATVFFSLPDAGMGMQNASRSSTSTSRATTGAVQLDQTDSRV